MSTRKAAVQPRTVEPPAPSPRRAWRWAAGVFLLAFVLRVAHVLELRDAPLFQHLLGDAQGYDEWARRIAGGDWLGSGVFYQAPLYPYLLGTFYALFGRDLLALRLVQAGAGAATCVIVALAAARWFDRRTGLAAGLLMALCAPALFFDVQVQKPVLDGLLVSALLLSLAPSARPGWAAHSLLAGVLVGLLALNRENALVLVPVVAFWAWRSMPRPLPAASLVVLSAALVLAPVAVRNTIVGGEFHLTTSQIGPNFYIGNHAGATGKYVSLRPERGSFKFERQDATQLAEVALGRKLGPSEVSSYWLRQALDWIRANPGDWLRLTGRKLVLLVNRTQAVDTEDLRTHAEYSAVLRASAIAFHPGVLVPLAAAGAWMTRRRWRTLWPLFAVGLPLGLAVVAFFVLDRYRYPLVPLAVLFAAAAIARGWEYWRRHGTAERAATASVTLAALIVCSWPISSETNVHALTHLNMAAVLRADGLPSEAETELRRALEIQPDLADAHADLGSLLVARGDHGEALRHCEEAVRLAPESPTALVNLGAVLGIMGKTAEASRSFEGALELDPLDVDAHANLGRALAAMGRTSEAIDHLREAVRLDPSAAGTHNDLGVLLCSQGRLAEGIAQFEAALQIDPGFAGAAANLQQARRLEER